MDIRQITSTRFEFIITYFWIYFIVSCDKYKKECIILIKMLSYVSINNNSICNISKYIIQNDQMVIFFLFACVSLYLLIAFFYLLTFLWNYVDIFEHKFDNVIIEHHPNPVNKVSLISKSTFCLLWMYTTKINIDSILFQHCRCQRYRHIGMWGMNETNIDIKLISIREFRYRMYLHLVCLGFSWLS